MATNEPNDRARRELGNGSGRPGRESRLLMLVVGVSLAVLFVLARFRFSASISVCLSTMSMALCPGSVGLTAGQFSTQIAQPVQSST